MSKLIVEMEMPRGCYFCPMAEPHPTYWFCRAFDDTTQIDGCTPMDKRRSWCPIVGVLPDEHGDLIDRDELLKRKGNCYDADGHLLYAVGTGEILQIKPIIAAERKDDEQIY